MTDEKIVGSVVRSIEAQIAGLNALVKQVDGDLGKALTSAITTIAKSKGRVILSGMGKSGHIARKISATLASTGTPAFFVHPAEASHGDLGMITPDDVVMILSWSGETAELHPLVNYARRFLVPLIVMTSQSTSALAKAADILLCLPMVDEAYPDVLAPTTSTTVQLVLGDAIAIVLLEHRGFTPNDFRLLHPGGKLGAQLQRVADLMHPSAQLPLVKPDLPLTNAVLKIGEGRMGCAIVVNDSGDLIGILTDGDVRRSLEGRSFSGTVADHYTKNPKTISPDRLASDAVAMMNDHKITVLVVSEGNRPVGAIHMHDLLARGVV